MDVLSPKKRALSSAESGNNISNSQVEKSKKFKKRKIVIKSKREINKKLFEGFRNKLKRLLPAVFKKDSGRGNFIFELFCDIIRMNNLIDTCTDIGCVEFIMTEQRISRALDNFFSIRGVLLKTGKDVTTGRCLEKYMTPYRSQFKELSKIGFGGFSTVVKAKHLLDNIIYAVKKVKMDAWRYDVIMKNLDEVKILAQLNHPNIVNYKQAWIERYNGTENLQSPQSSQTCSPSSTDFLSSIRKDWEFFKIISTNKAKSCGESNFSDEASQNSQNEEPQIVLYIQMSLCHQSLREWMNKRAGFSTTSEIEKIASQILCGLSYIHSRGVIHHDIKPENIFITTKSEQICVQLGDFGLGCPSEKDEHSQVIGTIPYVAPEQLNKKCDPKSDVYSFGFVLFELLNPMQSGMERARQFDAMKNDKLPFEIQKRYPEWVRILKKAIIVEPTLRPTAQDLFDVIGSEESLKIAKLNEEIERLREENVLLKTKIQTIHKVSLISSDTILRL